MSELVSEFNSLLGTEDIRVHVVNTSHVIMTYTLELSSSVIYIIQNLQATIQFKKKYIKKETQKVRAPIELSCHWRLLIYICLQWL